MSCEISLFALRSAQHFISAEDMFIDSVEEEDLTFYSEGLDSNESKWRFVCFSDVLTW